MNAAIHNLKDLIQDSAGYKCYRDAEA